MKREQLMVETGAGPALAATACRACGKVSFPARQHCPHCLEEQATEKRPLARRGRLFSFTTAEVGLPSLEAPYSFGFVDLPEGVRIFTLLEGGDALREGDEVELVVTGSGQGYRFRAVRR